MTTILVADDDPDVRDLLVFKLEQAGYRVIGVEDGVKALDVVRTDPPDLAVLDLMMPGLSGLDVCAEIRRSKGSAHLPIIMLTARVHEQDVATGFTSGADDYVTKPFSPRELLSRVQAVLLRAGNTAR